MIRKDVAWIPSLLQRRETGQFVSPVYANQRLVAVGVVHVRCQTGVAGGFSEVITQLSAQFGRRVRYNGVPFNPPELKSPARSN